MKNAKLSQVAPEKRIDGDTPAPTTLVSCHFLPALGRDWPNWLSMIVALLCNVLHNKCVTYLHNKRIYAIFYIGKSLQRW